MAIAIIVIGIVFSQDTYGQSGNRRVNSIKSPRDVATGQATNRGLTSPSRTPTSSFTGSDEELGALIAWGRAPRPTSSLIDTSTGEIVWATTGRSSTRTMQANRRVRGLIDTSTGEIVW
ncbi:MAG: hypothetical protein KA746_12505 [Pyrinomonadaceae bacterium]|nr:hypothetical protein [Pyrinomonadaceae bacterium]